MAGAENLRSPNVNGESPQKTEGKRKVLKVALRAKAHADLPMHAPYARRPMHASLCSPGENLGAKRVDVGSLWGPKVSGARHAGERSRGGFFRRKPRKPRFKTEGPEGAAPRYCTGKTHENAQNRRKMTPTELSWHGGRRKP